MNIGDALQEAADVAGFTQQDMATWLGYENKSATQQWLTKGVTPHPVKQKHIAQRLTLLKRVLTQGNGALPVPPSITQFERKAYIEGVRDRALKGIFRAGASG